jgi:hypothetical protein
MQGKDARPLIDHAIESQGKYRYMKDELTRTINVLSENRDNMSHIKIKINIVLTFRLRS